MLPAADPAAGIPSLRPLLEVAGTDATSDLSRRHAILTSATGVTTVVGGKLTTYRRMAEDTVDALVAERRLLASERAGLLAAAERAYLAAPA